jgi:hypothetical protein
MQEASSPSWSNPAAVLQRSHNLRQRVKQLLHTTGRAAPSPLSAVRCSLHSRARECVFLLQYALLLHLARHVCARRVAARQHSQSWRLRRVDSQSRPQPVAFALPQDRPPVVGSDIVQAYIEVRSTACRHCVTWLRGEMVPATVVNPPRLRLCLCLRRRSLPLPPPPFHCPAVHACNAARARATATPGRPDRAAAAVARVDRRIGAASTAAAAAATHAIALRGCAALAPHGRARGHGSYRGLCMRQRRRVQF